MKLMKPSDLWSFESLIYCFYPCDGVGQAALAPREAVEAGAHVVRVRHAQVAAFGGMTISAHDQKPDTV